MKCPKCEGLMIEERYLDAYVSLYELKCVNCGLRRNIDGTPIDKDRPKAGDITPCSEARKCVAVQRTDAAEFLRRVQPEAQGSRSPEPVSAVLVAA